MALAQKYVETRTGATHKLADASVTDFINPTVPLDAQGTIIRLLVVGALSLLIK